MTVKITADSTCDLSPSLLEKYQISLIPLSIVVGEAVFHDGVDISPEQVFQAVSSGKSVNTAAVNVYEYQQQFKRYREQYDAIIHICIGKAFSACYANACQAARNFSNVFVVDSGNLSTGSAHLVLDAAEMAASGMAPKEIVAELQREVPLVDASFVIDQVDYLYHGGRCTGVEAIGAKMLRIKPSIEVVNGQMKVGKKYRGGFDRCLEHYLSDRLTDRAKIDFSRVFITHSPCADGVVDYVLRELKQHATFLEVIETNAGCTVCSHCGPNTLGMLFKRKEPKK